MDPPLHAHLAAGRALALLTDSRSFAAGPCMLAPKMAPPSATHKGSADPDQDGAADVHVGDDVGGEEVLQREGWV